MRRKSSGFSKRFAWCRLRCRRHRCCRHRLSRPPEGLPMKPVAKALNAVQQAVASAAESAIESAKEAA